MVSGSFVREIPIRIGSDEEFVRVASALKEASFDEETLLRTLKIKKMSEIGTVSIEELDLTETSEQLKLFLRLFISLSLVPRDEVEQALEAETLGAFESLGLLKSGEYGDDQFYATVLLYPVAGFFITSDRHSNPDGSDFTPPPDIVFPAIYGGTLRFLELIPKSLARDALDLCAGSGIGAFLMSRFAARAVSSDITERATEFARFNRALNGCRNVEAVCGDLYGAVEGQQFDRITAHPPYVPSLNDATIWRDGGRTGESLVRRIIEGVPQHLRAGGLFCAVSIGLDTESGLYEERVRGWLGETADEFDIIFAYADERDPEQLLDRLANREKLAPEEIRQLMEAFEEAGTRKIHYGALVMRRRARSDGREPWTERTRLSEATKGEDFEWAFDWHERTLRPDFIEELKVARPQLAPRLQLHVTHVVRDGSLVPAEFLFETDRPFEVNAKFERTMIPLILRLNGKQTTSEIYERARQELEMPGEFGLEDLANLVSVLVERGILVLTD